MQYLYHCLRILDSGFWILDSGFWILGPWIRGLTEGEPMGKKIAHMGLIPYGQKIKK